MSQPIAIIGIGCVFPGANSPDEFWRNLVEGRDIVADAGPDEFGFDVETMLDPAARRPDTYYAVRGGFVREFTFDASGYDLSAEQLHGTDPQIAWSLDTARQALVDGGYRAAADKLSRCGVVLGNLALPTRASRRRFSAALLDVVEQGLSEILQSPAALDRLSTADFGSPANDLMAGFPAALVARALSLGGPRLALDAACASSLYAIKLAADYLTSGSADLMLAGATSCADPLFVHLGFSIFRGYPEDGVSRPLDQSSTGLVSGEGAGMVLLKRYSDAVRDGDRIYAVIRGTGLSNDGAGKHLLVPKPNGQALAFQRAYAAAGTPPGSVSYVECHATGTPLGDATELDSMAAFFDSAGGTPQIGSVKSNFGHLLTASGIASVIKVVLSMAHDVLPPTINVLEPMESTDGSISGHHILRTATRWPKQAEPRRAAVSAFGFGGTNAHLVLEEAHVTETVAAPADPTPASPRLAVIGMDIHAGRCVSLAHFDQAIFRGEPQTEDDAPESFALDFMRAKVPPNADDMPIAQQLLMVKVADRALHDSGIQPGSNVAVIVGMGTDPAANQYLARVEVARQLPALLERSGAMLSSEDLNYVTDQVAGSVYPRPGVNHYLSFVGNTTASRIASVWDFNGPAFMLSAEANSANRALEVAQLLLAGGDVEAVVVAAVDTGAVTDQPPLQSLSRDTTRAWAANAGAGAIVLRQYDEALQDGNRIYASIDAVECVPESSFDPGPVVVCPTALSTAQAHERALTTAGLDASAIGYLEVCGSGTRDGDEAEFTALARVYGPGSLKIAVGSGAANVGDNGVAGGLVGIIRAALCLAGRYLPATPGWTLAGLADELTEFYVPEQATPWFVSGGVRRAVAVSTNGLDGCASAVIMREGNAGAFSTEVLSRRTGAQLVPLAASSLDRLMSELGLLEQRMGGGDDLEQLARRARSTFMGDQDSGALVLALIASDADTLQEEIGAARGGILHAIESGRDWESSAGSYFAAQPLGKTGELAFVYPGAFNSYVGMGRGLLSMFPALHDRLGDRVPDPGLTAGDRIVYPRSRRPMSKDELSAAARRLRSDAVTMMESGTTLAVLHTAILREEFGVRPNAALGYSMGEGTMLWALEAWQQGEEASQKLRSSRLFSEQLVGPCQVAGEWARQDGAELSGDWTSYLVKAPVEMARARLAHEPRAFLTHVNTPTLLVISGESAAVESVVADLGDEAIRAPMSMVLHCEPTRLVFDDLVALNRQPTNSVPDLRFYSIADYAPISLDRDSAAWAISEATCQPVDFPRLVDRAYRDGARVFVELGPSNSCSKWIHEILADRSHVVASMNRRDLDDASAMLRVLAKLTAHGVVVDLGRLNSENLTTMVDRCGPRALVKQVRLGRNEPAVALAALAEELTDVIRNDLILDGGDLREFGEGKIANVFGSDYEEIDSFARRVRLPAPPYLLVSRVTGIQAQPGVFKPCSISTEYDIPFGAWYTVDRQIPWAVAVESGQCDLLLVSYLGIDFENRGKRVYRLLDCTLTFLGELPKEGQTLRYEIHIDSFARTGDTLLFFFGYECYVGDEMVLKMEGGCAGFFTDEELAHGRGVIDSPRELAQRKSAAARVFNPPLSCNRREFSDEDFGRLSTGRLAASFGAAYEQHGRNPSLRLPPSEMLALNRVVELDPAGGAWGLGMLVAEHDLDPDNWYFGCHFVDDQVLAGSLMAEACVQLLQFYMLFLGFSARTEDARFQPIPGVAQAVRCRGQVTPRAGTLTYRMEVTDLGLDPLPVARANVDVILDDVVVVRFNDVALQLVEKADVGPGPAMEPQDRQPVRYTESQVAEFTTGAISACFGPEFAMYDERRAPRLPNGDLQLVSRVLSIDGELGDLRAGSSIVAECDVARDPWFYRANSFPTTPYSILMELGLQPCGFLSASLGSPMIDPDKDFYFRNLDGSGHLLREVDLRGKTVTGRARLSSSNALAGVIIQQFTYSLECEGEQFFTGDASFGYFTSDRLATGAGLDDGRHVPTWLERAGVSAPWQDLGTDQADLFSTRPGRSHQRLAGGQLHLIDAAAVSESGGTHGLGYICAKKSVDPESWFFRCHFYQDPVMPGSLGVEAMIEAIQLYVLQSGLCADFESPRFGPLLDHRTVWKYRGQIAPSSQTMTLEAHISRVDRTDDQLVVIADASLWCEGIRIYAVKQLALTVTEV